MNSRLLSEWSSEGPTVGEVGESAILELLVSSEPAPWLPVPNGDDAAVLDPSGHLVALSVDAVLEHQHFKREWLTPSELGARALYVSASDLAAMGVLPKWCLISAQLPPDLPYSALAALAGGIREACDLEGITVVGGNLAQASPLGIHLTVGGHAARDRRYLTRSGARVGDFLWLTDLPGRAAAGRRLLDSSFRDEPRAATLIQAWRRPAQRWSLMSRLISEVELHAAIDLSDGFGIDAGRMASSSGARFRIDLDALGEDEALCWAAQQIKEPPLMWALAGGEDYEVLVSAPQPPPSWALDQGVRVVGRVEEGPAGVEFTKGGSLWEPDFPARGWDPFR